MSAFKVEVVRIGKMAKHPNADTLSITSVYGKGGYPVIFRTGEFREGDLAIYVPVDAIMPEWNPDWQFLRPNWRIKAKKLRGIFSQGILLPMSVLDNMWRRQSLNEGYSIEGLTPPVWKEGDNVQAYLFIEKYEEAKHLFMTGDAMATPSWFLEYTSLEAWKRGANKHVLQESEFVCIREKIHGANGRWCFKDGQLWVGSHHQTKKEGTTIWWEAAKALDLQEKLSRMPDTIFFGEVYGKGVQDLQYGMQDIGIKFFDAYDLKTGRFMDDPEFMGWCSTLGLEIAPSLYRGPWHEDLIKLAEGESTLAPGQVREGFVVKPVKERWDERCGRVIFKVIGEGYLLRKSA